MPSTFTWLDYSEHERRKMLDVIDLFSERTTRDELGLGSIRDAFADLMFPGTSTIQTRAKYFLLVPWVFQFLEAKRVPSAKVARRSRKLEIELIMVLLQGDDTQGVIGRRAKEKVQRLPSGVYWQGLRTWGIRKFEGSQDEYNRSLDVYFARRQAHQTRNKDFDGETQASGGLENWHHGLPPVPPEFPQGITSTLLPPEAEYLRDQICQHCDGTLLAFLVRERWDVAEIPFAWDLGDEVPAQLRLFLQHGKNFSEIMLGAALLYNLMIAEKCEWAEKIEDYRERLADWWGLFFDNYEAFEKWDRVEFWKIVYGQNARVHPRAKDFVESWIGRVLASFRIEDLTDDAASRNLIHLREHQLKRGLARLENARGRELWKSGSGEAGSGQMDLRWIATRRIIVDIVRGLG